MIRSADVTKSCCRRIFSGMENYPYNTLDVKKQMIEKYVVSFPISIENICIYNIGKSVGRLRTKVLKTIISEYT